MHCWDAQTYLWSAGSKTISNPLFRCLCLLTWLAAWSLLGRYWRAFASRKRCPMPGGCSPRSGLCGKYKAQGKCRL